jgi:hypothetical protein
MRFRTIWTMPAMTIKERLRRTLDWAAMKVAANLPLRVRYWVAILEIGHATAKSPNVPATSCDEILNNLRVPASMS